MNVGVGSDVKETEYFQMDDSMMPENGGDTTDSPDNSDNSDMQQTSSAQHGNDGSQFMNPDIGVTPPEPDMNPDVQDQDVNEPSTSSGLSLETEDDQQQATDDDLPMHENEDDDVHKDIVPPPFKQGCPHW